MEQIGERKEQVITRNLLTHPEETIQAMAQLEGPAWLENQSLTEEQLNEEGVTDAAAIEDIAHNSVIGALHHLRHFQEVTYQDDEEGDESRIIYNVYGLGGVHRWYVRNDGVVVFSKSHATQEHSERAQELGFELAS